MAQCVESGRPRVPGALPLCVHGNQAGRTCSAGTNGSRLKSQVRRLKFKVEGSEFRVSSKPRSSVGGCLALDFMGNGRFWSRFVTFQSDKLLDRLPAFRHYKLNNKGGLARLLSRIGSIIGGMTLRESHVLTMV